MITEDMKKAIQNEVKKQLEVLKEKDGTENKVLTPYQKTIKLLKSYRYYKNRIEYLKNNLDNIEIKKKYSIGEIKAVNNNLSEMEKKEIIKEERLKEIEFFEYGINLIDYGLSSIEDEKYKEIIPLIYFEKLKMEDVAEKFSVDTSTIKRNRNKLVEIMSLSIFDSEILKNLIKNIF
ncbi:hypothetical protein [Fusobacterium animalis]|uniref:Uncharacterized protein n=1 Tax=Fusobacterium animalis TaxID=76859 RepID=A0A0M4SNV5_9FUSO|nr:hypothetical protein [Fusobacterium animalis]ALF16957.1 hypothetical protein RN98_01645 [Fusobacterium animalis]